MLRNVYQQDGIRGARKRVVVASLYVGTGGGREKELFDALSETAADLIESLDSRSLISSITSWELAVKTGLGRLRLPYTLGEEFDATVESMGFEILPLTKAAL